MNRLVCASLVTAALAGCGSGGGGGGGTIAPAPTVTPANQEQGQTPTAQPPLIDTTITIGDIFTPGANTSQATGSMAGEFNYQSYGAWGRPQTIGCCEETLQSFANSTGKATPNDGVPTTGTATYTGSARGVYWEDTGNAVRQATTSASMTAGVDFSRREVAFSTSNTTLTSRSTLPGSNGPAPEFDLSGTLRYSVNNITGTITTRDGLMSGPANARFYGDKAQEIGGVYRVETLSRGSGLTGGFGGKR
jgi:hypothetical protein